MLPLSAMDITLITAGITIGPGFDSFVFVACYPALALFVVVFTPLRLRLAWTTMTAAAYALVNWTRAPVSTADQWDPTRRQSPPAMSRRVVAGGPPYDPRMMVSL